MARTWKGWNGRMKKRSKRLIIGGVILLAVGGIVLRGMKGGDDEEYETRPTVVAENPERNNIILYTELTGTIEPVSRAAVRPKISGELLEVYFQAGEQVEAGQILCRIDSDALTSLQLQMESASVAADKAARELNRLQPLYEGGYVSQQEYEQARDGAASARLAYEAARNQYELQLEYTTVTAPISGIIESRNVEPHDHVSGSTEVCVISGSSQVQVKFGITEKILGNMKLGNTIEISKNGIEYSGNITEIGTMVNSQSGLYDVKASINQANGLMSGTKVKLTVVMNQALNVMTVPVDTVNYDNGEAFVYCWVDGIAKKTMIESGIYDSDKMEVKSGLEKESLVITSWSNELLDGAEVLLEKSSPVPESR